jgi:CubicO group peptidase (beta-lactamase class C family)
MRQSISVIVIGAMLGLGVATALAQTESETALPRLQLRVETASQPSLRDALADEDVQSALREHVRGLDLSNPFQEYPDFPLEGPARADTDEGALAPLRELSEGDLRSFGARSARPAPRRADPDPAPRRVAPDSYRAPERPHFDVELFGATLEALFPGNVNGYILRVRQHGQTIYSQAYNWAQRPEDAGLDWTPTRRQHVASVSKFITAMGLARMLDDQGISFDTPIIDYLPDYWQTGPNIEDITFAHLMNHVSGFHGATSGTSNFISMRARVGQGVPANDVGNWQTADYQNMNFGLCRILMATLGGYIDTDATFGTYSDVIWNWIAVNAYTDYIDQTVFAPAGVTGATLANADDSARAYAWDDTGPGWDSGFLMSEAGGAGWHLSADEVLDVVGEFRRGGGIVSSQRAMQLMNLSYGLNSLINGFPADTGRFFYKMGRWWNGEPDQQAEQSFVMVLPEDMELVILVNSPLGPNDFLLQDFIGALYLQSIVSGE